MSSNRLLCKLMWRLSIVGQLISIVTFCLAGCVGKGTIHVGFAAQLTGVQAELGIQERNGALLAVDDINKTGGVGGHPLELIVQDDLGTPEGARAADRKLIDAGVVAIIGHATSAQTIAGLDVTNPAHIVMLSPTATTPELSGLDDYFFRVSYSLVERAHAFAQHVALDRKIAHVAVIFDTDNVSYSRPFLEAFSSKYQLLGDSMVAQVDFSSKKKPDFAFLVAGLRAANPDGLLIIASDVDAAFIAQQTRLLGWSVPLFTTSWAQTETLITAGGQGVEGMEVELVNTLSNPTKEYLDFKKRYQDRYGQEPAFGASVSFEAVQVLAAALQMTAGKAEGLPLALVNIKGFKGLSDTISFDKYGDVVRPFYLGVIRDSKYVDLEPVKPVEP
jgi:branched-chain amino acid transport system substrate-binding protein